MAKAKTIYFGVDPGKSGAIAFLDGTDEPGVIRFSEVTLADLWGELYSYSARYRLEGVLEQVGPMPGQGVVSMFTFGQHFGYMEAMLTGVGATFERVRPQAWQRELGCPPRAKDTSKSDHKRKLRQLAQELFPKSRIRADEADALLLAAYARRRFS